MKKRTKKGFVSTIVGISISFMNAIIQFLLIYWILRTYGTEFNGFIRLTSALTIIGGTTEGALGVSTVILLIKPLADRDFITANEIFSTAKTRYRKTMVIKGILILLIAVLYPLEIMIGPNLLNKGDGLVTEMPLSVQRGDTTEQFGSISFWELMIIITFFGVKNLVTSGVFGVYENLIQADQQNGMRRVIILFTDVLIYGFLFALLNVRVNDIPLNPLICFSVLIIYGFVRGFLVMLYVKRNYPWLKYYKEFNNFQLRKTTGKMFWTSIGQSVLFNSDIIIVVLALGAYGLRTSSMLSLYLIVGLNTRLIMTNFITSFREYFTSIMVRDGRLEWKDYSSYELYIYVVAAFTFVIMALLSPYLVNALYGDLVAADLNGLVDTAPNLNVPALLNANKFMFQKPVFSILYAATTAFILIIQGQYTLIQAKGRIEQISKWIDIIALVFVGLSFGVMLIFTIPQKGDDFIVNSLIAYYSVKIIVMVFTVVFLWCYNWSRGTYNSNTRYTFWNLLVFTVPVVVAILVAFFVLEPFYPVINDQGVATFNEWTKLLLYLVIVIASAFVLVGLISLSIRPKVSLSLFLMLPIVKQIVDKSKSNSRYKRLRDENIDLDYFNSDDELNHAYISSVYNTNNVEFSINTTANLDDIFKPKIYKLKEQAEEVDS